jgi:hypothetical protein
MITMQTNLSAMVAAFKPAGGEMSGLTAHFLFGPIFRSKNRQIGGDPGERFCIAQVLGTNGS